MPRGLRLLSNLAIKLGLPTPLQFGNLSEWPTKCRETFIYVYWVIVKIIIKNSEQPDEGVHRGRSGRILSVEASVPLELGCDTLLACGCVHQPEGSPNPTVWDFYGGFITWVRLIK